MNIVEYDLKVNELINRKIIEMKKEMEQLRKEIKENENKDNFLLKLNRGLIEKYKFTINYLELLKEDIKVI